MTSDSDPASNAPAKLPRGSETPPAKPPGIVSLWRFVAYVLDRFAHDGCQQRAASLTFTSLLAIVPLLAVSFAIFAAFPAYARLKDQVQSFIFQNMIPQVGSTVQSYFESFTAQTGGLTTVGVIFLALSAVMLMVSVSNTFNRIWRVRQSRSVVARMVMFWAIITLTPLLFGASISISSYLFTAARQTGVEDYTGSLSRFGFLLPFFLQAIGFTTVFVVMPNYPVRRSDAVIGGLVASTLFEILKKGFGLYIVSFPTYQTIYGAMATVPIFLVWVYLVWMVVLVSAEMTAALPEWRAGARHVRRRELAPLDRMLAALGILGALRQASTDGGGLSERVLLRHSGIGPDALAEAADFLTKRRYIARGQKGEWLLTRDLGNVTLYDLYTHLELGFEPRIKSSLLQRAWARRFATVRQSLNSVSRETMAMPLDRILAPPAPGELHAIDSDDAGDEVAAKQERRQGRARILALLGIGAVSAGS